MIRKMTKTFVFNTLLQYINVHKGQKEGTGSKRSEKEGIDASSSKYYFFTG